MKIEKLYLMQIAAQLTAASNLKSATPDVSDPANPGKLTDQQKLENLEAWNVFTIFYVGLLAAHEDENVFKTPKGALDVSSIADSFTNGALAALVPAKVKPFLSLLAPVLNEVFGSTPAPTTGAGVAIPAPGGS